MEDDEESNEDDEDEENEEEEEEEEEGSDDSVAAENSHRESTLKKFHLEDASQEVKKGEAVKNQLGTVGNSLDRLVITVSCVCLIYTK